MPVDRARQQLDVADRRARRRPPPRLAAAAAHRELLAGVGEIALELLALVHQRGDARRHVVDRDVRSSAAAGLRQSASWRWRPCARARPVSASMRRTPEATALSPITEISPISPVRLHMGAAAQFDRPAERVAVLAASRPSRRRAPRRRISRRTARARRTSRASSSRHQPRGDLGILQHDLVGDVLDPLELFRRDRLRMREVEAQPVGRHQRALLRDVIAEHLAQRLVQQMGRGMVGADRRAARVIDLELQRGAGLERALLDRADMHEQIAGLLLGVGDAEAHALARVITPVSPTWPPDFAIERRLVQHDRAALAGFQLGRLPCRPCTSAVTTPSAVSVS